MDLSNDIGEVRDTATVELYHPATGETLYDDNDQPMWVEVYGQDSEQFRKTQHALTNRSIKQATRTRGGGGTQMRAEQVEAQATELLVAAVRAWHVQVDGETPPCEPDTVRRLFRQYPFLREQVEGAVYDRKNFLTASSGS